MNSLERVLSTVKGKPTDRRAVSMILSLHGARFARCSLQTYFTDPKAYAKGQLGVQKIYRPDIIFGPFSPPLEGSCFGTLIRFHKAHPPTMIIPAARSIEHLMGLVLPDAKTHPVSQYFQKAIGAVARDLEGKTPIAGVLLGPVDLPVMIMGMEGWLQTLLLHQREAVIFLERVSHYFVQQANMLLSAGATFLMMPALFADPAVVSRDIIRQIALPILHRALAAINGPIVLHAGGAEMSPFLDLFSQLPKVIGFVLGSNEDLNTARQNAGENHTLIGTIDGPMLHKQTPDLIQKHCRILLEQARNDPRFILGTSGGDIAYDAPGENIRMVLQTAEKFIQSEGFS